MTTVSSPAGPMFTTADLSGEHPTAKKNSTFITVMGWLGVLKFAPGLVVGLLQVATLESMLASMEAQAPLPSNLRLQIYAVLFFAVLLCALGLWTSVRLLQRENWARRLVRAVFVLTAAFLVVSSVSALGFWAFSVLPGLGFFVALMVAVQVPFALGFAYAARKLGSAEIVAEFSPA